MKQTRAKKFAASKSAAGESNAVHPTNTKTLDASVTNPPHVFILPQNISRNARIISLPSPATSTPCRYLLCPEKGCYEFTRVAASKKLHRSWLLAPDRTTQPAQQLDCESKSNANGDKGYVLQTPDLMVATPVDPLFLILPALVQDAQHGGKQFYLPAADYVQRMAEDCPDFKHILSRDDSTELERLFEASMVDVCSSMDDGSDTLYIFSTKKLLDVLVRKAERMVEKGLPDSMEARFVKQPLIVPVLNIQNEQSDRAELEGSDEDATASGQSQATSTVDLSQDTQTSCNTVATDSTTATSISDTSTSTGSAGDVVHLLRLRTALTFLLQSYVPAHTRKSLTSILENNGSSIDFSPLDNHLTHLDKLKKEAQTLRSLSDNISRKRSAVDKDDDEALARAEVKKRKKEEEEMKKKSTSRGVKQLEKADRSGMKTLSSFFAKAPAKKKV